MKTKIFIISLLVLLNFTLKGQNDSIQDFDIPELGKSLEGIGGNVNLTGISDNLYFGTRLTPEVSIWKIGFGLDIPLLIDLKTGKLRTEEYKDGVGALRIVRYFRFGIKKRDNFYFRIGELRDAQLGFGMLISEYNNSISFEKRKIGFELDFVIKKQFGLEILYSDLELTSLNLLGIRPYYKPFGATGIPILKTFEIGLGYVTDHDKTYLIKNDSIQIRNNYFLSKGINAFSADAGFWILNLSFLRWSVYSQFGYMLKNNSDSLTRYIENFGTLQEKNYKSGYGWSIGSDFKFHILGNLLKINYRAERYWHTDYFIPRFFNFYYEINKDEKIKELLNTTPDQGTYLKLQISVLDKIILKSSLLLPDNLNNNLPAEFYGGLDISNLLPKIIFTTNIYQGNINKFSDVLKFKETTQFETIFAYKILEIPVINLNFVAGIDFRWTYSLLENFDFKAVPYYSPFFKIYISQNQKSEKKTTE